MFSCMWGLSIHMDARGHLIPVARKSKFEFTLQFVVKILYLSNIFKIAGIIFLNEE